VATFLGILLAAHWPAGSPRLRHLGRHRRAAPHLLALGPVGRGPVAPLGLLLGRADLVLLALALAALILWRHRANIARLLAGTEPRIGRR
jgi:glycerol-3-phosphate acyltransferase PlsY